MTSTTVVSRFAPSPTGYLHLGGARTALFAYLIAKAQGGKFVLRFEDTDRERSDSRYEHNILEALDWLELIPDEQPVRQSERITLYQKCAELLIANKRAYWCNCSSERLDELRRQQTESKSDFLGYDGHCRTLDLAESDDAVLRFARPETESVAIEDQLRGKVEVQVRQFDDFVIRRSNGAFTYNYCCAVDDADMAVTDVVRGDDHLTNTLKQKMIYDACGWQRLPKYYHLPQVMGSDGKRLSKRTGAADVLDLKRQGYFSQAVISFLARLGWSYQDQDTNQGSGQDPDSKQDSKQDSWTLAQLETEFLKGTLLKSSTTMQPARLDDLNKKQLAQTPISALVQAALIAKPHLDAEFVQLIAPLYRDRAQTLQELAESCALVLDDQGVQQRVQQHKWQADALQALNTIHDQFSELNSTHSWHATAIEDALKSIHQQIGGSYAKVGKPLRMAILGATNSPALPDLCEALGYDRVQARLDWALQQPAESKS